MFRPVLPVLSAALAAAVTFAAPAGADDDDHDRARRLTESGAIRPLDDVLARLAELMPGEVVEIELGEDDGRFVYEFTVIRPDGRVFEVEMDAATRAILETEEDD